MSDAPILLRVEAQRKLGWVAALFNLFLPGAGYLYCGRWFLGLVAFSIWVAICVATQGTLWLPIALLLFVDGFRCVAKYNKRVINEVLTDEAARVKHAAQEARSK